MVFETISYLKMSKFSKNSKFGAVQIVKMTVFGASKQPKLISRTIMSGRKILKCPYCVLPIRLPRSVK